MRQPTATAERLQLTKGSIVLGSSSAAHSSWRNEPRRSPRSILNVLFHIPFAWLRYVLKWHSPRYIVRIVAGIEMQVGAPFLPHKIGGALPKPVTHFIFERLLDCLTFMIDQ